MAGISFRDKRGIVIKKPVSDFSIVNTLFSERYLQLKPVRRVLLLNRMQRKITGFGSLIGALNSESSNFLHPIHSKSDVVKLRSDLKGLSLRLKTVKEKLDLFSKFAGGYFTFFHPISGSNRFSRNEIEGRLHLVYRNYDAVKCFVSALELEVSCIEEAWKEKESKI